jgi:hypothetical protein
MTSIEWLFNKLWEEPKDKLTWYSILEEAKEMHKQEMSDSYQNGWMSCEKWFEDKELDDHIVDTNEMVELPQQEISDEEIEKFADEELGTIRTDFDFGVIQGMKWYREQLKNK